MKTVVLVKLKVTDFGVERGVGLCVFTSGVDTGDWYFPFFITAE